MRKCKDNGSKQGYTKLNKKCGIQGNKNSRNKGERRKGKVN